MINNKYTSHDQEFDLLFCCRPGLEERLEEIISGAALLADSNCTRDDRKERIVSECNAVRQALQVSSTLLYIKGGKVNKRHHSSHYVK